MVLRILVAASPVGALLIANHADAQAASTAASDGWQSWLSGWLEAFGTIGALAISIWLARADTRRRRSDQRHEALDLVAGVHPELVLLKAQIEKADAAVALGIPPDLERMKIYRPAILTSPQTRWFLLNNLEPELALTAQALGSIVRQYCDIIDAVDTASDSDIVMGGDIRGHLTSIRMLAPGLLTAIARLHGEALSSKSIGEAIMNAQKPTGPLQLSETYRDYDKLVWQVPTWGIAIATGVIVAAHAIEGVSSASHYWRAVTLLLGSVLLIALSWVVCKYRLFQAASVPSPLPVPPFDTGLSGGAVLQWVLLTAAGVLLILSYTEWAQGYFGPIRHRDLAWAVLLIFALIIALGAYVDHWFRKQRARIAIARS